MPTATRRSWPRASPRYIELYENIVGERFERERSDEDIAMRIEKNVSSWLKAFEKR